MKCPACGFADSKVIDSRHIEEGNSIRRRRECLACQKRYTTFEIVETVQIIVTKKNTTKSGVRLAPFNRVGSATLALLKSSAVCTKVTKLNIVNKKLPAKIKHFAKSLSSLSIISPK